MAVYDEWEISHIKPSIAPWHGHHQKIPSIGVMFGARGTEHADAGGTLEDTVSATKQLLKDGRPLVLAGFFSNRNITDLVSSGLREENSIAVVGYRTTEIRPEISLLYKVRAKLRDEINSIANHLATVGINRIGLFYKDGPGAASLLAATDEAVIKTRGNVRECHFQGILFTGDLAPATTRLAIGKPAPVSGSDWPMTTASGVANTDVFAHHNAIATTSLHKW